MSDRPTPETDDQPIINAINDNGYQVPCVDIDFARKLERERDEAREALREWQTLRLWGAEPQHIHDFIKGQQTRIHESQEIEKTCEQLERERDEAREAIIGWENKWKCAVEMAARAELERDKAWSCCDELVVDSNAVTLAKTVMALEKERDEAVESIMIILEENRHLADGDNCTLAKLKSVVPEWK